MHSGKLFGALGAVLCFCVMFTLAVPRKAQAPATRTPGEPGATPSPSQPVHRRSVSQEGTAIAARETESAEHVRDGSWCPEGYGFCLPAPDGWTAGRRRTQAWLRKDPAQPDAGGFNVLKLPNVFGRDLQGLLEENRAELEANPQFDLHAIAITQHADRQMVRIDYSGTPNGGSPTHFVGLVWLAGPMQVVLTFTVAEPAWSALEPSLQRSLDGLRFGPRHP